MAIPLHTIEVPDGLNGFSQSGWAKVGLTLSVAYPSESTTTDSTVVVSFDSHANMPSNYAVFVEVGAALVPFITSKTASGFTLNLHSPAGAGITAGTANLLIVA